MKVEYIEETSVRKALAFEIEPEVVDKEIADRIGVKHGTVRWHLQHVYEKLHVRSRTEAALKFRSAKTE